MPIPVTMPRLSDTMEEGTLVKWLVKVGDKVKAGDHLADVETDKATMELQSFEDGTVAQIVVPEGETAAVGKPILVLAAAGESVEAAEQPADGGARAEAETRPGTEPAKAKRGKADAAGDEKSKAFAAATAEESDRAGAAAETQGRPTRDVKREGHAAVRPGGEAGDDGGRAPASAPASAARNQDNAGDDELYRDGGAGNSGNGRGAQPTDAARPSGGASEGARIRVSPLARKIAEEHGIDFARVPGSGPEGRVVKRDVLAAVESGQHRYARAGGPSAPAAEPPPGGTGPSPRLPVSAPAGGGLETKLVPVSGMRKTIARRLVESKTTVPHFTVTVTVNMDPLLALRATLNTQLESQGVKLSVNDFIVRAVALALLRHPLLNASWTDAGVQMHGAVNVGVAVTLPQEKGGGLVVPVIRDAHGKGLRAISQETRALADKARTRGLGVAEMSDGTFTVSNLGMMGVDHFEAIINPPQAAILAVGAALKKPVVRPGPGGADQLTIGHEMTCTLSGDHRVIDGAVGAEYLATLKGMLENPAGLLV